jgi:hypothetical protein
MKPSEPKNAKIPVSFIQTTRKKPVKFHHTALPTTPSSSVSIPQRPNIDLMQAFFNYLLFKKNQTSLSNVIEFWPPKNNSTALCRGGQKRRVMSNPHSKIDLIMPGD